MDMQIKSLRTYLRVISIVFSLSNDSDVEIEDMEAALTGQIEEETSISSVETLPSTETLSSNETLPSTETLPSDETVHSSEAFHSTHGINNSSKYASLIVKSQTIKASGTNSTKNPTLVVPVVPEVPVRKVSD